ncbi:DUF6249 domain-containing protein [Ideonella sp. DXS29W]|uniref:DUF6249 domain-containing protein n=1 Tax=Ideonella lacteola TaxID=2984193 RepID=A0ABU9BM05_9BURK
MNNDVAELRHIMPFLIPIVAIVMGIGIAMLALWVDYRKKRDIFELHHKERLLAIERGMEVPPLPDAFFSKGVREARSLGTADFLRRGLIWLLVGLGVGAALAINRSIESATWALIPIGFGLANLIFYSLESRRPTPRVE